jgi:hypothetical protein
MARHRTRRRTRRVTRTILGSCESCGNWIELTWSEPRWRWICAECGSHKVTVPSPGSTDASLEGCSCDPEPNNAGHVEPERGWVIDVGCVVHDPFPEGDT